jgi:hypothetical protein
MKIFMALMIVSMVGLVSGCKTRTQNNGASSLESDGHYNGPELQLSQLAIFYPGTQSADTSGSLSTVFPVAILKKDESVSLVAGQVHFKIMGPCSEKVMILQESREIGCNMGRGHFFAFARFDGPKVLVAQGGEDTAVTKPQYVQQLKFIDGMATLHQTSEPSRYELLINIPR